jgi:uncharacterized protein involved in exopolysaccharide biosynthesis
MAGNAGRNNLSGTVPQGPMQTGFGGSDSKPEDIRATVQSIARVASRRRWLLFFPFCIAATSAFLLSHFLPRTYRAVTKFERRDDPALMKLPASEAAGSFLYFRRTLQEDILGREVMSDVAEKLGLTKNMPRDDSGELSEEGVAQRDALITRLASDVSARFEHQSDHIDMVSLIYEGPDGALMRPLLDTIKKSYTEWVTGKTRDMLHRSRDFFKEEQSTAASEMAAAQRELNSYRLAFPDLNIGDSDAVKRRIAEATRRLEELLRKRREIVVDVGHLRAFLNDPTLAASPEDMVAAGLQIEDETVRALRIRIDEVDRQIVLMRDGRGMTEQHPTMVELNAQRSELDRSLRSRLDELAAAAQSGLKRPGMSAVELAQKKVEMDLAARQDQLAAVDSDIADIEMGIAKDEARRESFLTASQQFVMGERELSNIRQEHETCAGFVESLDRILGMNANEHGIRFFDPGPATGSLMPVAPTAKTIILMALMCGIVAGIGLTVFAELFNNRFRSIAEVAQSLQMDVLERIGEVTTQEVKKKRWWQQRVFQPAYAVAMLICTMISGYFAYQGIVTAPGGDSFDGRTQMESAPIEAAAPESRHTDTTLDNCLYALAEEAGA